MSAAIEQRNQDATIYVGNLDEKVHDELLWEFMLQAGPVVNVHMPKDKVSGIHQGYGFVEFRSEEDADYAMKIMNMIKLYGKPIKVNKASQDKKNIDVGANVFIGNLDPNVDEKLLYDTFSAFGGITQTPKIMRDQDTNASKGYAFVSYDSFESSDIAIECMNGQYLCNRSIVVQYAFKKESQGERHGSQAERMLAANNPNRVKPHTTFSAGESDSTTMVSAMQYPHLGMSALPMPTLAPQVMPGYNPTYAMPPPPPSFLPNNMMMMPPPPPAQQFAPFLGQQGYIPFPPPPPIS
jgi:splicing factor 3B subunit 4